MLDTRRRGILVVVVVPALADGQQGDEPVVAARLAGLVVAVAEHVGERVHRPGDVPHCHDPHVHTPDHKAQTQRQGGLAPPADPTDRGTGEEEDRDLCQTDPHQQPGAFLDPHVKRIAENILGVGGHRIERMGLPVVDHQPAEVRPKKRHQRRMGVGLLVGMDMVDTVHRHPAGGRILEAADPEDGEGMFDPGDGLEAAVREEAVVADRDPLPEDMDPDHHRPETDPREELRHESQQCQQVDREDRAGIDPVDRIRPHRRGDV